MLRLKELRSSLIHVKISSNLTTMNNIVPFRYFVVSLKCNISDACKFE